MPSNHRTVTINFAPLSRLQAAPIAKIADALHAIMPKGPPGYKSHRDVVEFITDACGVDRHCRFMIDASATLMEINVLGMIFRQYGLDGYIEN